MESEDEVLDIEKLIDYREILIDWVDNHFTNKDDFKSLLKSYNIVYEKSSVN